MELEGQVDIPALRVTQPKVGLIQSRGGRWNAASLCGGGGRAVYEHADLSAGDIAAGSRMPIDLALRPGPKQSIQFHGSVSAGRDLTEAQGRIEWKNPEAGRKMLGNTIAPEFDAQCRHGASGRTSLRIRVHGPMK